jgi:hypothetical protein
VQLKGREVATSRRENRRRITITSVEEREEQSLKPSEYQLREMRRERPLAMVYQQISLLCLIEIVAMVHLLHIAELGGLTACMTLILALRLPIPKSMLIKTVPI